MENMLIECYSNGGLLEAWEINYFFKKISEYILIKKGNSARNDFHIRFPFFNKIVSVPRQTRK